MTRPERNRQGKRRLRPILLAAVLLGLTGCGAMPPAQDTPLPDAPEEEVFSADTQNDADGTGGTDMKLWIEETEVPVIWEDNAAVQELAQQVRQGDITISMSMYSDNEQVGPLGRSCTRNDVQTTTHSGDIVLYSGDQIVVFYGSNRWAYTRLGKMDLEEQAVTELLANGNVTLRLTC